MSESRGVLKSELLALPPYWPYYEVLRHFCLLFRDLDGFVLVKVLANVMLSLAY